jgi:hypothetical protein
MRRARGTLVTWIELLLIAIALTAAANAFLGYVAFGPTDAGRDKFVAARLLVFAWQVMALVSTFLFVLIPAAAAPLCHLRADGVDGHPAALRRWLRYAVLFGLVLVSDVSPRWADFHEEVIGFTSIALSCARGIRCPLVGQPMLYGIHLGPVYYYLMTTLQWVSTGPVLAYVMVILQFAAAAVLLARCGDGLLGSPWGVVAGALAGFSGIFAQVTNSPDHGAFVYWPAVGFVCALLAWIRWREPRAYLVAALSAALMVQMHGITFPLLLALGLFAIVPRAPLRTVAWAILGWLFFFFPWLVFQVRSALSDFRQIHGFEQAFQDQNLSILEKLPLALDGYFWPCMAAGVVAVVVRGLRRSIDSRERQMGGALLVLIAICFATWAVGRNGWTGRYSVILYPAAPLLSAIGIGAVFSPLAVLRRTALRGVLTVPRLLTGTAAAIVLTIAVLILRTGLTTRQSVQSFVTLLRSASPPTLLVLSDFRRIAALLAPHGFRAIDLDQRVHGVAWRRYAYEPAWMEDIASKVGLRDANVQALLLQDCRRLPEGFALWQERLDWIERPTTLAVYRSNLSPVSAELIQDGEVRLSVPIALPFFERFCNYLYGGIFDYHEQMTLLNPDYRLSDEKRRLLEAWSRRGAAQLVLRTTFDPGGGDRRLVLAHDPTLNSAVEIGGSPAAPLLRYRSPDMKQTAYEDYGVPAGPAPVPIEVRLERGDSIQFPLLADLLVDLYEAPLSCG